MTQIGQAAERFFAERKLDLENVVKLGIFTGIRQGDDGDVVPSPAGEIIVFPSFEAGKRVNCKYRARGKRFWQQADGVGTIFPTPDVLDDPALADGSQPFIWVEGEMDAITLLQCGFPFTGSVPHGAPPVPKGKAWDDLDPMPEDGKEVARFEFMYRHRERLQRVKRFIMAGDADDPGRRLTAELVRRLGPARCSFVIYPPERVVDDGEGGKRACKDMNEVLMHFGANAVVEVLNRAKPYPVRGLYKLSDYPQTGKLETFSVGWDGWGPWFRLFFRAFVVVSGIPGQGKTSWALELLHNVAQNHGWTVAVFSPENRTVPMLRDTFRAMRVGRKPGPDDTQLVVRADEWIEQHVVFIDADPDGDGMSEPEDGDRFNLEWLIRKAEMAVVRHGIRVLLIDPWNEIEHSKEKGESVTDYIARAVRALKAFARRYDVVVIVVAHPTKDVAKDGSMRTPRLYDIEGSATWYNKADLGVIVERPDRNGTDANIYIQKVRHIPAIGRPCKMTMKFDPASERFKPVECGLNL